MSARDAVAVARVAREAWTGWLPGDGSAYRVRLVTVEGGSDYSDRVLLLSIQRQTVAFQFSLAEYRHLENGPWTAARCREQGIPSWAWRAARPLLAAYGVTRTHLVPSRTEPVETPRQRDRVETVELPGDAL